MAITDSDEALATALQDKLTERQTPAILDLEKWYDGRHPKPAVSTSNNQRYLRFQAMAQTNLIKVVVDSVGTRLSIDGIRFGKDSDADLEAWKFWQDAGMDAKQTMLFTTALADSMAYISVWPDDAGPMLHPEHPTEVVSFRRTGRKRGLESVAKIYYDTTAARWCRMTWTDGRICRWWGGANDQWQGWTWTRDYGDTNPFGETPFFILPNQPNLHGQCFSEMTPGIPIQKRINQQTLNLLVAGEAAAFPQRWATGLEIEENSDGTPKRPFKSGPDKFWVSPDENTKFGQFTESEFKGYLSVLASDTEAMSSTTSTPIFTLSAQLNVPPSADSLVALESSLIKKCEARQRVYGEAVEDATRFCFKIIGDDRANDTTAEVIWKDASIKSDAAVGDFVVKASSVGVPREALWEKLGASPQEIERWKVMAASEAFMAIAMSVAQGAAVGDQTQQPAQPQPVA